MADIAKLVEELSKLTVLEAAELAKALEEEWGVSAAAALPPVVHDCVCVCDVSAFVIFPSSLLPSMSVAAHATSKSPVVIAIAAERAVPTSVVSSRVGPSVPGASIHTGSINEDPFSPHEFGSVAWMATMYGILFPLGIACIQGSATRGKDPSRP